MPDITLVPITAQDLEAFIDEEVADYADERLLDEGWSRRDALDWARAELRTVITWERQATTAERQRLLTAITPDGRRVGWVWVKLAPPGAWSTSAFLCQMTVMRGLRHQGYGRAILAALEALLTNEGTDELLLNVWESNLPAKSLYHAAGYTRVAQLPTMRRMRKRLRAAFPVPHHRERMAAARTVYPALVSGISVELPLDLGGVLPVLEQVTSASLVLQSHHAGPPLKPRSPPGNARFSDAASLPSPGRMYRFCQDDSPSVSARGVATLGADRRPPTGARVRGTIVVISTPIRRSEPRTMSPLRIWPHAATIVDADGAHLSDVDVLGPPQDGRILFGDVSEPGRIARPLLRARWWAGDAHRR